MRVSAKSVSGQWHFWRFAEIEAMRRPDSFTDAKSLLLLVAYIKQSELASESRGPGATLKSEYYIFLDKWVSRISLPLASNRIKSRQTIRTAGQ